MAMNLQPHYFPAVCRKCGDVTQCLRSPLMRALKVGQCGIRQRNGSPCRGDVFFTEQKSIVSTKKKPEPIVVGSAAVDDLLSSRERPYDLNRKPFAADELTSDERADLDQLNSNESWGVDDPIHEES